MTSGRRRAVLGGAIFLAFVLDTAFSSDLEVKGARPDLTVCVLLVSSLFVDANGGAALGFLAGLLESSFTARFVGSFIVSRTLAGFALGALEDRLFRDSWLIAVLAVLLGTAFIHGSFFLFAPQPNVVGYFRHAGGEAVYNSVLALPLYLAVRRLLEPSRRRGLA